MRIFECIVHFFFVFFFLVVTFMYFEYHFKKYSRFSVFFIRLLLHVFEHAVHDTCTSYKYAHITCIHFQCKISVECARRIVISRNYSFHVRLLFFCEANVFSTALLLPLVVRPLSPLPIIRARFVLEGSGTNMFVGDRNDILNACKESDG